MANLSKEQIQNLYQLYLNSTEFDAISDSSFETSFRSVASEYFMDMREVKRYLSVFKNYPSKDDLDYEAINNDLDEVFKDYCKNHPEDDDSFEKADEYDVTKGVSFDEDGCYDTLAKIGDSVSEKIPEIKNELHDGYFTRFDQFFNELKNASTFGRNSKEYNDLVAAAEKFNNHHHNEEEYKENADQVIDCLNKYFEHKGRRGVNKNAEGKMIAAEKMFRFFEVDDQVDHNKIIGRIDKRSNKETKQLNDVLVNGDEEINLFRLDDAYRRIKNAAKVGLENKTITQEEYDAANVSISNRHKKFIKYANSKDIVEDLTNVYNKINPAHYGFLSSEANDLCSSVHDLIESYKDALDTEKPISKVNKDINGCISRIRKELVGAKQQFRSDVKYQTFCENIEHCMNDISPIEKIDVIKLFKEEKVDIKEPGRTTVASTNKDKKMERQNTI